MCLTILGVLLGQAPAHAQAAPSLVQMVSTLTQEGVYSFDAAELAAAQANDIAWTNLQSHCQPTCPNSQMQSLYQRLRDLEDTADELLDRGETQYSLHLDPKGIAAALRWTAPEEYAAQGSITTNFANSQVSLLTQRFAALQFVAQQFRLAEGDSAQPTDGWSFAYNGSPLGGGAGDDVDSSFTRWSAYINGGYGSGSKEPTVFEDAFNFDSTEISAGIDYRVTNRLVVGLMGGHTERRLDFNSNESTAGGGIRGNGESGIFYLQLEGDAAYVDVAIGAERMRLDMTRQITYPSNNPSIPAVDDTSYGDATSTSLTGTLDGGYTLHWRGLSVNPYLDAQYIHTRIPSFSEFDSEGFAVQVASQSIPYFELGAGLKIEYVLNSPIGVFIPYIYGEARHQFLDGSRNVTSTYAAGIGGTDFSLPTDETARNYYVAGGGGSVVLPHGFQAFAQYVRTVDYTYYTDHVISGGIRWEF